MKLTHLQPPQFIHSQWSGGTTTQLFISPPGASYAAGDFDVRVSSATVDVEESTFTSLPGVSRKLMILDGALAVSHQHHYDKMLAPFEVDVFEGDWHTTGRGRCIDFNVMTKGGLQSSLHAEHHLKGASFEVAFAPANECILLYVWQGALSCPSKDVAVPKGDALLIEADHGDTLRFTAGEDCTVVVTTLFRA